MPTPNPFRLSPLLLALLPLFVQAQDLGTARRADALAPTTLEALSVQGQQDVRIEASGDAVVERGGTRLQADRIDYDLLRDEVDARGNVRLQRGPDRISGPRLRFKVEAQTGQFESPEYSFERQRGSGTGLMSIRGSGRADSIELEGEKRYRLRNASFSTCESDDPAWFLKARELELDFARADGSGNGGVFHFGGLPVFYTPYVAFPLDGERRSGVLAPTFSTSNVTGFDFTLPYYFNLAPNYDDTLAPRYMARRGLQLNNEFRYLGQRFDGALRTEWLPSDAVYGQSRSAVSFLHQQVLGAGFSAGINYNAVSDKDYFTDLSSRVTQTSTDHLIREARVGYSSGSWFTSNLLVQRFQTIAGAPQYNRLPQFTATAFLPELAGFSLQMPVDATYFKRDESTTGWRAWSYPQLQYNFVRPAGFITPKFGVHVTEYQLDEYPANSERSMGRNQPIASLDSGLYFERAAQLGGRDFIQTLEPRLYYLNVPYREQSDLPVFDSGIADYGFAQIFSENLFAGQDRIANANQLTAALSSRFIDADSGAEALRVAAGSRVYFTDQRVTLPGQQARTGRIADLLGSFSGKLLSGTTVDMFAQYNPRDSELERATLGLRFQPRHASALGISYRYQRGQYTDVDITAQWPIAGGWYGVARVNGDVRSDKLTQAIAGLEYNASCWVLRAAAHRLLTTGGTYTNAYYLQLEFGGVLSVGNSPVSLLERSLTGYGRINQPIADPVFGSK